MKVYESGQPSLPGSLFEAFLEQTAKELQGQKSSFGRSKPLVAFDPVSFLSQFDQEIKMNTLKDLMGIMYSTVDNYGVDIAICCPEEESYTCVQMLKDETCPFQGGPFWMLTDNQKETASSLAGDAKARRLSIFIGAGISFSSGGPSWGGLLDLLAIKAGYSDEDREKLKKLGYLDQPTIIAEDLGDDFKPSVAEIINESSRFTPVHAMLKTLKIPAITTNYDVLYEKAAASCNEHIPQLPWDSRQMIANNREVHNSLLKLHGCVDHPESIVLSRADYMRYPDVYQALRGRLHGIFLTTRVLFLGFSMTDDNVHKVIDDVRKVVYDNGEPSSHQNLGTILSMTENSMFDRLWDQDFDVHAFGKSWGDNPPWYHDCFIDCLATSLAKSD